MNENITPSYFIPHGGWPWNLMWNEHMKMTGEIHLKNYFNSLWEIHKNVDAIVLITSHWEAKDIKISFVENYELLYDYYGFPQNTYWVKYPVKGSISLAQKVEILLNKKWIQTQKDFTRWLDHGSFVPLMEIFPKINIPVVQVSISNNLDPLFHYQLWKALASLKTENILILWSGMSYHNMKWFFSSDLKYKNDSVLLNHFLEENISQIDVLLRMVDEPFFREAHPRREHFMPFFTILWTQLTDVILRDIKIENYGKEIVGYKVI